MDTKKLLVRVTGCCLLLALGLLMGAAPGETERGDLDGRFADVAMRKEYGGETYYRRSRVSAVMVTGVLPDATDGQPRTDFAVLFAIDDNERRITPVYIDGSTIVAAEGNLLPLREVYALGEDPEENCRRMVAAVDGLLGGALIESFVAVDLDGVTMIAEFSKLEGDARERLHLLRLALENIPSKQLNRMYGAISEYLTTDMKSGAVMRLLDKTDRYEIAGTVDLPTLPAESEDGTLAPDGARILELVIELFYSTELF